MRVAVGFAPQLRLIIEIVELHAASVCRAMRLHEMGRPLACPCRCNRNARIKWVIARDFCAVVNAVATISIARPTINNVLCAIDADLEAASILISVFGDVAHDWHGHNRICAILEVARHPLIGGNWIARIKIIMLIIVKKPIIAMIDGVQFPVVACGVIAAPTQDRQINLLGERIFHKVQAINVGANRLALHANIDRQHDICWLRSGCWDG